MWGAMTNRDVREITLRGAVPEADQDRMTFQLKQARGSRVVVPMPEQCRETIVKAFSGYRTGVKALVQGVGRYDRKNRLVGLESVRQVRLLDPLDVPTRLNEFRDMEDGWLEGSGFAPTNAGLTWLSDRFDRHYRAAVRLP